MSSGHVDTTIKTAVQNNTVFDAVLDATAILNWRNELAAKIDGNYDLLTSVTQQAIINGNFAVNQRVKSGTVTLASGAYGHDRWKAGAAGCTYTFTTVNNVTTITITAGSLIQVIEGINLFSGTYTLSWAGTAQGKIGAGAFGATGITGAATGGTNLSIEFNTGTLSKVQFNVGNQALPFQPRSFAEELALCQRYYEKSYDYSQLPGTSFANNAQITFRTRDSIAASTAGSLLITVLFKVRKRTTPTVTLYSVTGTSGAVRVAFGSDRTGATAGTLGEAGFNGVSISNASATAITLDAAIDFHYTVDAEL